MENKTPNVQPGVETIDAVIAKLEQLLAASTQGEWFAGAWSGKCRMQHRHDGAVCKYEYTLNPDWKQNIVTEVDGRHVNVITTSDEYGVMADWDSDFITAAHNHMPELLAEIRRLRTQLFAIANASLSYEEYSRNQMLTLSDENAELNQTVESLISQYNAALEQSSVV